MTVGRPVYCVFLSIYAIGFVSVGWLSRPEANFRRRLVLEEEFVRPQKSFIPAAMSGGPVGAN